VCKLAESDEKTKDVTPEEAVERPWASNDKLQFDNTMCHCKNLMTLSELNIKNALEFQEKLNNEYLAREQQLRENNRFTLNYLYGIYPEEATGLVILLKELLAAAKSKTETK
jgi:hypothetical protein